MSRATPLMRDFAERLVVFEMKGTTVSAAHIPVAFQVCEKLRPHLATLMGSTGFHALLMRALAVANTKDPWLRMVQVRVDGSLEGLDGVGAPADPAAMTEGSVVLVAQLLALLVAFIGENLTLRMVREVWPQLPLADFDSAQSD